MKISENRLTELIELYEKEFNEQLTPMAAHEKAQRLLRYVQLCIAPLAKLSKDDITKTLD